MTGDSVDRDPEVIRCELESVIRNYRELLCGDDLREKVRALIPAFHSLRELGSSLLPTEGSDAGKERVRLYLFRFVLTIVSGDELMVVSGIQEYARRLRELRKEDGWRIMSGLAAREMNEESELEIEGVDIKSMKPDDYVLLDAEQDREAAHRWHTANSIRKSGDSVSDKCLAFLRANVGSPVLGEELRYVAKDKTEWARRVRELRTEQGWPVATKVSGRPDLGIGIYVLEADRQSPEHDRAIPDLVRREVLRRDGYRCAECGWNHDLWNRSDARHLELHHIHTHAAGGENSETNLRTLCTSCHDEIHRH